MQGFACSDDARELENRNNAAIAPAVERTLGKGEVACSNHAGSTIFSRQTVLKHAYPIESYDVIPYVTWHWHSVNRHKYSVPYIIKQQCGSQASSKHR